MNKNDFSLDWSQPVFWVAIVGGFANQILTYTSDQSVIQRYITVKDTADTKKSLWLKAALTGFAGSVIILLAANAYTDVSATLYGFIGLSSSCIIGWLSSFVFGYRKQTTQS